MKTTGILALLATVMTLATACGGLNAENGTAYETCADATCEVIVEKGTKIDLDPDLGWEATPGQVVGGWQRLTVTDVGDSEIALTLSAKESDSTGGTATILPADSKPYYLDGMSAKVLDAADGRAVLSLRWTGR
ncbi:hypothetical protein J2S40_002513 [Nocardioides luteus]|uniref:Lipoprotein n=1 Tax=Nocardioides luteus TaxID=1844 RepID=A0ABQ5T0X5_9ACTN|nr:hypothetical protein [Nocardioides luteus]MDR7311455.1 hypothetical protein [Nocardioides luteus]GGR55483.1 hypothetical protein GCM10010197_22660 [Nocardioides luteus]GLJ70105.1 hypothetical protein GCM10017579_41410 [Nocardioides luteus]